MGIWYRKSHTELQKMHACIHTPKTKHNRLLKRYPQALRLIIFLAYIQDANFLRLEFRFALRDITLILKVKYTVVQTNHGDKSKSFKLHT